MKLEIITKEPAVPAHSTPLLFVHGAWHAAWSWEGNFLDYFSDHGYQCWAPSLRGHGSSPGRANLRWTSVTDYVEDVSSVVDQMPRLPVLIGHSMGGLIVQRYLEKQPAAAAVLLATVPASGVLRATMRIAWRRPIAFAKSQLMLSMYPLVETPELAREMFLPFDTPDEKVRHFFDQIQDESFRAFLDMLVFALPRPARVTTPVLVIGAQDDMIFYPHEQQATARAYGAQATLFRDMPHDMMLGAGWREVADHILNWLKDHEL